MKRANGKCLAHGGFLEVSLPLLMKGGRFQFSLRRASKSDGEKLSACSAAWTTQPLENPVVTYRIFLAALCLMANSRVLMSKTPASWLNPHFVKFDYVVDSLRINIFLLHSLSSVCFNHHFNGNFRILNWRYSII